MDTKAVNTEAVATKAVERHLLVRPVRYEPREYLISDAKFKPVCHIFSRPEWKVDDIHQVGKEIVELINRDETFFRRKLK